MNNKEKFDKSMDKILLENDFAYYSDWEYGLESGWSTNWEHYTMKLFKHSYGYWIILEAHASGEHDKLNIGSLNNAKDIIALRDALKKLW